MERWRRERLSQLVGLRLDYRRAICHYGIIILQRDKQRMRRRCTCYAMPTYCVCFYTVRQINRKTETPTNFGLNQELSDQIISERLQI